MEIIPVERQTIDELIDLLVIAEMGKDVSIRARRMLLIFSTIDVNSRTYKVGDKVEVARTLNNRSPSLKEGTSGKVVGFRDLFIVVEMDLPLVDASGMTWSMDAHFRLPYFFDPTEIRPKGE